MPQDNTVVMEGVKLIFRNFEGKEGQYNRAGDRNFGVLLEESVALAMQSDGWNVKQLKVREEEKAEDPDAVGDYWIQVALGYGKGRPPRVVMITERGRTNLDEETVSQLDWVDIQNVDLIVRPYNWEANGKTGVKAYLQSIYVTIDEDDLERKYADLDAQQ